MRARVSSLIQTIVSNFMKNKQNTQIDTAQLDTFLNNAFCAMGSLALALDEINNLLPAHAQVTADTCDYMRAVRKIRSTRTPINNW